MGGMRSFTQDTDKIKGAKINKDTLMRVLKYAKPYKWFLALFLVFIIIDALIGAWTPLLFKAIIDKWIPNKDTGNVIFYAGLTALLSIISALLSIAQRWVSTKIGQGVIFDLQNQLFEHIQKQSLAFFSRTKTGALVQRINGDVMGAQAVFTNTLSSIFSNTLSVVFTLAAMLSMSWQLTLIALLLIPAFIFPAKLVGPKLSQLMRESYDLKADATQLSNERFNVSGALLAKSYGDPKVDAQLYAEQIGKVRDLSIKQALTGSFMRVMIGTVSAIALAVVYGFGGVMAIKETITVGVVVALASYLNRLYGPITSLSNIQVDVLTALVSFERVFEILDLEPSVKELPNPEDLRTFVADNGSSITFENVSFRYPKDSEVSLGSLETISDERGDSDEMILKNISFNIEPGQMVALVGPSGAGKSTLSGLISRMYDPNEGTVSIAGKSLRDVSLDSIRETVGVVSQDAHMFHDTIAANLRYAKPDATEEEMIFALKEAYIYNLVEDLPQGLETVIGDRGYRLSGGERQRLAIARLLLKSPNIVVLDEATAHLDSESEHFIQEAFETALAGRTSVVIAHRLSTIRKADKIIVLKSGEVVEMGTHDELIAKEDGVYHELHDLQFSDD
ncbi:ABC transporter ATP-binding protein [Vagococcus zengguangii]|uniref:ABC transporter ATP-binding protein n=2 Tax=Vagococcus zengguangii TaxID=2571750 RepID=A0A4D7CXS1_9ENTE|nr:ABC transporter ATP-binding protein [Vagococcus zengguangii]TLG80098.1 ABC transporter ATP-binding protein [Vagococcus zengguangii]